MNDFLVNLIAVCICLGIVAFVSICIAFIWTGLEDEEPGPFIGGIVALVIGIALLMTWLQDTPDPMKPRVTCKGTGHIIADGEPVYCT